MASSAGFNLNSTPLAAARKPCTCLRFCSFRTRNFGPPFTLASRSPASCACVRVRVIQSDGKNQRPEFVYTRAKPEVRWPHKSDELLQLRNARQLESAGRPRLPDWEELSRSNAGLVVEEEGEQYVASDRETSLAKREEMVRQREAFRQRQKGQARRLQNMSKLALRKATDLKNRARRLTTAICSLELARPVTDVLDAWPEQLNNDELSVVVRNVGDQVWQRALELYEWLNLQKWYTPNPRLLATMLHILGRAKQLEAARELFLNAEPELSSCIQVFNAILGVYAKQGHWEAVEQILELIEQRGCEPDIITFNTIANARCKYDLQPGMASALLKEIERAGLRPDITTYNTLLGGCIANKNVTEASEIIKKMEQHGFDLNACSNDVIGKFLSLDAGEKSVLSTLDKTSQQQASSNDVQDDSTVQQTTSHVVAGNMNNHLMSNMNRFDTSRFQAGDTRQMVARCIRSPEAVSRPAEEPRFSMICLFMQWKAGHAISRGDQTLRCGLGLGSKRLGSQIHAMGWMLGDFYHANARETSKQLHLCKVVQEPLPDTEKANYMLSGVRLLDNELVQVVMQQTSAENAITSSYINFINECKMRKDYSSGLERFAEMVEAGIEPGCMTWICVLQACGQCAHRVDLLRFWQLCVMLDVHFHSGL